MVKVLLCGKDINIHIVYKIMPNDPSQNQSSAVLGAEQKEI